MSHVLGYNYEIIKILTVAMSNYVFRSCRKSLCHAMQFNRPYLDLDWVDIEGWFLVCSREFDRYYHCQVVQHGRAFNVWPNEVKRVGL